MKDFVLVLLTILVIVLGLENSELRLTIETIENGYIELMERKVPGTDKALGEMIKPGTLGIFGMRNRTVVCGELNATVEKSEAAAP